MKDPCIHFVLIFQYKTHNSVIRLWKQAAAAVINRSNFRYISFFIIKKSPVTIMPVKISQKSIDNKHIPEMFL